MTMEAWTVVTAVRGWLALAIPMALLAGIAGG